jgi:hypothetical protein
MAGGSFVAPGQIPIPDGRKVLVVQQPCARLCRNRSTRQRASISRCEGFFVVENFEAGVRRIGWPAM